MYTVFENDKFKIFEKPSIKFIILKVIIICLIFIGFYILLSSGIMKADTTLRFIINIILVFTFWIIIMIFSSSYNHIFSRKKFFKINESGIEIFSGHEVERNIHWNEISNVSFDYNSNYFKLKYIIKTETSRIEFELCDQFSLKYRFEDILKRQLDTILSLDEIALNKIDYKYLQEIEKHEKSTKRLFRYP